MNIFDKSFSPSEAQLRYLDADYVVMRPGSFVRCAVTGVPIPLAATSLATIVPARVGVPVPFTIELPS